MDFQRNSSFVDGLIAKALREDDEAALNHLFKTFYNRLFRAGLKYGASGDVVEDAIQAVFVDLWKYRHQLGTINSFEAYLKTAVRRRLFKIQEKDPVSVQTQFVEQLLSIESFEEVLIRQEADEGKRIQLTQALSELSPRQKEIIILKYFEEYSYAEIAEKTQLQIDTIYKIIHEALRRLRFILVDAKK